jgi:hypothetical protein
MKAKGYAVEDIVKEGRKFHYYALAKADNK